MRLAAFFMVLSLLGGISPALAQTTAIDSRLIYTASATPNNAALPARGGRVKFDVLAVPAPGRSMTVRFYLEPYDGSRKPILVATRHVSGRGAVLEVTGVLPELSRSDSFARNVYLMYAQGIDSRGVVRNAGLRWLYQYPVPIVKNLKNVGDSASRPFVISATGRSFNTRPESAAEGGLTVESRLFVDGQRVVAASHRSILSPQGTLPSEAYSFHTDHPWLRWDFSAKAPHAEGAPQAVTYERADALGQVGAQTGYVRVNRAPEAAIAPLPASLPLSQTLEIRATAVDAEADARWRGLYAGSLRVVEAASGKTVASVWVPAPTKAGPLAASLSFQAPGAGRYCVQFDAFDHYERGDGFVVHDKSSALPRCFEAVSDPCQNLAALVLYEHQSYVNDVPHLFLAGHLEAAGYRVTVMNAKDQRQVTAEYLAQFSQVHLIAGESGYRFDVPTLAIVGDYWERAQGGVALYADAVPGTKISRSIESLAARFGFGSVELSEYSRYGNWPFLGGERGSDRSLLYGHCTTDGLASGEMRRIGGLPFGYTPSYLKGPKRGGLWDASIAKISELNANSSNAELLIALQEDPASRGARRRAMFHGGFTMLQFEPESRINGWEQSFTKAEGYTYLQDFVRNSARFLRCGCR